MYVTEQRNICLSDPNGCGIKDASAEDDNIIISESTIRSLLPPQLKQISEHCKVM